MAGAVAEARVDFEPEQAAVVEVVRLRAQVLEHRPAVRRHAREDLDDAALLGDERAAIRRERDRRRQHQPTEHDGVGESGRDARGIDGRGHRQQGTGDERDDQRTYRSRARPLHASVLGVPVTTPRSLRARRKPYERAVRSTSAPTTVFCPMRVYC